MVGYSGLLGNAGKGDEKCLTRKNFHQLLVQIANEKISAVQREYDQTQVNIRFLNVSLDKILKGNEAPEETEDKV